jgi:hypothetical protein
MRSGHGGGRRGSDGRDGWGGWDGRPARALGQDNIGPGGSRFNQSKYKASHNPYWGEPLDYPIEPASRWHPASASALTCPA